MACARAWVVSRRTRAAVASSRVRTMPPPARGDDLVAVEGEAAHEAVAAHGTAAVAGAQRLRGILDHGERVPARHLQHRVEIDGMPVEMHGHHRTHDPPRGAVDELPVLDHALAGEEIAELARVESPGHWLRVEEERVRAAVGD